MIIFRDGWLSRHVSWFSGQQKSFLVALKLANFEYIKSKAGFSPILLLDDIFDKIDA
jgi:recombinational DNA repair ATPase RecF